MKSQNKWETVFKLSIFCHQKKLFSTWIGCYLIESIAYYKPHRNVEVTLARTVGGCLQTDSKGPVLKTRPTQQIEDREFELLST